MTEEWQNQWQEGKAAAAKKAIPHKVGDAMWIRPDIAPWMPITLIDKKLEDKYPVKIVAYHARSLWNRKERYTIEYPSGMRRKVERWRLWKADEDNECG